MSEDILKDSWVPEGPVSKKIKERIKKAGKRFHSNDNISEFIEEGEMDLLQAEVQEKLQGEKHLSLSDVCDGKHSYLILVASKYLPSPK